MVGEEEKSSQGFRIWVFGRFRQIILCRSTNKEREESKGSESGHCSDLVVWLALAVFPDHWKPVCFFKSHIWPITTTARSSGSNTRVAEWAAAPHGGYNTQLHLHVADLEKEVNKCTQESVFTMVQSYFASVFPFSLVSMSPSWDIEQTTCMIQSRAASARRDCWKRAAVFNSFFAFHVLFIVFIIFF